MLAGAAILVGSFLPSRMEFANIAAAVLTIQPRIVRLGFVGDMNFDRDVAKVIQEKGEGDYFFPLQKIADDLLQYDFLFGNLEGPVSDKGKNVGSIYSFRMNPLTLDALARVGFKAVSVANNHIGDWGANAMKDTFDRLNIADIAAVGGGANAEEAYGPRFLTVKGLRIAILGESQFGKGYTEATASSSGIAIINIPKLQVAIQKARLEADIVVASFHFGEEYEPEPNDFQKKVAHVAIDAGADIVVGHHPHVLEPLEAYKTGYIVYSLGNFIFDQRFSSSTMTSALFEVIVTNKKITEVKLRPVAINTDLQPEFVETN